MPRTQVALALAAVVGAGLYVTALGAQSSSANLAVTAEVRKNCIITTTPVAFGKYDPVAANATSPLDGTGTIVVTCTKGAGTTIALNFGSNAQGTTRRMQSGLDYLTYEIYKDAARTQTWGNSFGSDLNIPIAPSTAPRTYTAYGRIQPAQNVSVGNYADTVVATVNF
jgi:spore coat protein U-like protein